ncbi:2'-5' RNA ligase family protein [Corynebacterium sp. 335C]
MRLFAALGIPDDARDHLAAAVAAARARLDASDAAPARGRDARAARLRWSDPAQWHLTTAFHGEVPDDAADALAGRLAAVAAARPAPELRLAGSGTFGGRVLWAGVAGPGARDLPSLMRACRDAAPRDDAPGDAGASEPEPRPHVTLARTPARGRDVARPAGRDAGGPMAEAAAALARYSGPSWTAGPLLLVASELGAGPGGRAVHRVIAELPFGG